MKSFTTLAATAFFYSLATSCSTVANHEVTFYGWPDNDPASAQVAYSCGGRNNVAGGTGTYDDPLTFATAPGEYDQCEILYLPLLKKYIRNEDSCAECTTDFKNGKKHIDIWTGSNKSSGGHAQIECEDELTSGGQYTVVRQPPQGLEVDTTELFADGQCNKQAVFEGNQATCDGGATSGGNGTSSTGGSDSSPTTFLTKTTASATSSKKHKAHHPKTTSASDDSY